MRKVGTVQKDDINGVAKRYISFVFIEFHGAGVRIDKIFLVFKMNTKGLIFYVLVKRTAERRFVYPFYVASWSQTSDMTSIASPDCELSYICKLPKFNLLCTK